MSALSRFEKDKNEYQDIMYVLDDGLPPLYITLHKSSRERKLILTISKHENVKFTNLPKDTYAITNEVCCIGNKPKWD